MLLLTIYFALTLIISFIISLLFKSRFNKFFWPIFFLSFSLTFWLKNPGSEFYAPVLSIFLLESTFLESNGFPRILRPTILVFSLISLFFFLFFKFKRK